MLGCKIPFKFNCSLNNKILYQLGLNIISRLNAMLDIYGLEYQQLNIIQILHNDVNY